MSKSERIRCLKCGYILSLDELEKKECSRCKIHIDETTSTSFEEVVAKKTTWANEWKKLYAKRKGIAGEVNESKKEKGKGAGALFIGMVLVAVGIIALLIKLGVLSGSLWGYAWPIILIMLGLVCIFGRRR